ncbi:hypothetical protein M1M38_gp074 [Halorubrum tailed virus 27]|uniref:Uncharacterized protein n=1 Tax=Halorubrum tailed virus 27 TaxID=2878008 RepID=A0AAE8XYT5_9CAUD|nr:hypothetical protein M1M38_gp074 [Halorubrum tailed virus 27]UBF22767.1 hypothetical protein HRTV-27_gp74 [Halorubrum tailed virus 27]
MSTFNEEEVEPLTSPDTGNATKFHPEEADSRDAEYWKLMAGYNSGVYTRNWADETKLRRMERLAVFDSISGWLELTTFQKTIGRQAMERLDLREVGGISVELAAFSLCVLAAAPDGRKYHPQAKERDALMAEFAEERGFEDGQIVRALRRIEAAGVSPGAF